ncbi:MAG: DNA recombination protein RmuC [Maribacter sp.]|jgi:DNA recombination protein RmuC
MDIIFLILGLIVGAIAAWYIAKFKFGGLGESELKEKYVVKEAYLSLEAQVDVMKADLVEKEQEIREFGSSISAKEQIVINLEEKLYNQREEVDTMHKHMEDRFANLAERLFEEKSKKFTLQNQDQLSGLLNPFKEKFREFENNIEKRYWEESKERISLKEEIHQLRDLNMQLSEDANNLVNALKGDNKSQGDWGEYQLEVLLQKAGLEKGIHFSTQQSFLNENGKQHRPDLIINLPDDKHLVIDSKVSLKAYEAYFNSDNKEEREKHLSNHIASLRSHIKDLGSKNYQMLHQINSPDYLLMFIPVEPALTVALQKESRLFLDALDRNIVLVSNTTLLATMRTVSFIWKQEKQKKNVLEIARQSGLLYDKFCNFSEDLQDIGRRLGQAQTSYDSAMRKMSESTKYGDTLVGRAERIKKLGAKTTKSLPKELIGDKEE